MIKAGDKVIYLKRKDLYRTAKRIKAIVLDVKKTKALIEFEGKQTTVSIESLQKLEDE